MSDSTKDRIDFAISYAAEDIAHAREVTLRLQALGFSVFLADQQREILAGVDGENFFEQMFSNASQVVVFISENYKKKEWPRYEWDVIRRRENLKRFLPIRVDDVLILGLPDNIFYLDVRSQSYEDIANACMKSLLLFEDAQGIHRKSEYEVILDAIMNKSRGELAKAVQLVKDKRERTPLDDVVLPSDGVPQYEVVQTEWVDFSRVRRLSARVCVPEGLNREELGFNLRHCAATLFNQFKPDALMVFAYTVEPCHTQEWGVFNAGRVVFAPHGHWGDAMDGVAYNLPTSEFDYSIDFALDYSFA